MGVPESPYAGFGTPAADERAPAWLKRKSSGVSDLDASFSRGACAGRSTSGSDCLEKQKAIGGCAGGDDTNSRLAFLVSFLLAHYGSAGSLKLGDKIVDQLAERDACHVQLPLGGFSFYCHPGLRAFLGWLRSRVE